MVSFTFETLFRRSLTGRFPACHTITPDASLLHWITAPTFGVPIGNLRRWGSQKVSIPQLIKRAIFASIFALSFVTAVAADTFEDAEVARGRGDYAIALRLYRSLAERGDAVAQARLARMYSEGEGVPANKAEAAKWYRLLAEGGNVGAQGVLGLMYEDGDGVRQDYVEAAKWFHLAAEQGDAGAQDLLAGRYCRGQGVAQSFAEAARWYRLAAQQGNADAQAMLGLMHDEGLGAPQNYAEAAKWYRLAAAQGYEKGQAGLAALYDRGQGVPQNYVEASRLYRLAAEQGNARGQVGLASLYSRGQGVPQDYVEASRLYRLAAEQGNGDAQAALGAMLEKGRGLPQNYVEAAKWYRLSAEQGHAGAQMLLGGLYLLGHGVPQNYSEAAKWLRPPAEHGNVNAQDILANLYYKVKDYSQALKWYRLAAEQGDRGAQHNLGALYYDGKGVPQNYVAAYMWFSLAAAQGDQDAPRIRNEVAGLMTPEQLAEAQKRASEWRPKKTNTALAETKPRSPSNEKSNVAATTGTAFFVSGDGKMLTNAHVVEKCHQIRVAGSTARLLARDDVNDFALLAIDLHPTQWANWHQTVMLGEEIVAYGFPLAGVLSSSGNVVTGNVTALAGLGDDSRFMQISAPVQPGNSGGPLLDRNGNVVGVVVAKLNAMRIASATGDIPQNVNFAIKSSVAMAFLDAQRVPRSEDAVHNVAVPLSTPEIATRAQSLSLQVICLQ